MPYPCAGATLIIHMVILYYKCQLGILLPEGKSTITADLHLDINSFFYRSALMVRT